MKLVHIIDGLRLGGTENQLLSLLPDLAREHEIVLVTLTDVQRAGLGILPVAARYSLGFTGYRSMPRAILKLRRIIAREAPDLVRSQLFWSSVVARLATPKRIPLIFSIHSTMSEDGYAKRPSALRLEKLTYKARHHLLSVSAHALADFDRCVGIKGRSDVLSNFVDPRFVGDERKRRPPARSLRLIAVGNLKPVKNYALLLQALKTLPDAVHLDIYGDGALRASLEREIASNKLRAKLMGIRDDMWNVMPGYDLFVMPSLYEGCPNAAIEAMASGVPLLLSDIPVMREVSDGNALFFDPHDPASLAVQIGRILAGEVDLEAMSARGIELVRVKHLKADYLQRLNAIYVQAVASAGKRGETRNG